MTFPRQELGPEGALQLDAERAAGAVGKMSAFVRKNEKVL